MNFVLGKLTLFFFSSFIIISLLLTGISYAEIDFNTALGMWLFDESEGDIAKDSSDNSNDVMLMNGTKWVKGKFGTALEFDGQDDYVVSSSDLGISGNAERTVVFWFKPTSSEGRQSIVVWGVGEALKLYFVEYNGFQGGPNNVYVGGFDGDAYTEGTLSLDQWHHVAVVFPGKISETKVYYNGISQEIRLWEGNQGDELETVNSLVSIGYDLVLNRQPFKGAIDEVAIFNVALSEDDIQNIMAGLGSSTPVFTAGKLATVWGVVKAITD